MHVEAFTYVDFDGDSLRDLTTFVSRALEQGASKTELLEDMDSDPALHALETPSYHHWLAQRGYFPTLESLAAWVEHCEHRGATEHSRVVYAQGLRVRLRVEQSPRRSSVSVVLDEPAALSLD